MNNNSKTCKDCKLQKSVTDFYASPSTKDKIGIYCKPCHLLRSREASRKYRATPEGRAKHREEERKRRLNNAERVRALGKITNDRYKANNPEARKISVSKSQHKRRAQKQANGIYKVSNDFYAQLYLSPCVGCGTVKNITADHIVPISRGGTESETNLQPLCGSCNSSKGNKLMSEWLDYRKENHANV